MPETVTPNRQLEGLLALYGASKPALDAEGVFIAVPTADLPAADWWGLFTGGWVVLCDSLPGDLFNPKAVALTDQGMRDAEKLLEA